MLLDALAYDRQAVLAGEWWRLLTAHLVHLGTAHAAAGALAAALGPLLFRAAAGWPGWTAAALAAAAAVDAGLLLDPAVRWYAGASGLAHGLLAYGAVRALLAPPATGSPRRLAAACLAVLAAKLAWEACCGALPASEALTGGPVHVAAHRDGALGGLLAALAAAARTRHRR